MGEVDLGLDLVSLGARRARGLGCSLGLSRRLKVRPYPDRFIFFDRTGVRLLLGNPHQGQYIENRFTFDFQLPCQIVDSNLTHPPSVSSALSVKPSCQPHGTSFDDRTVAMRHYSLFSVVASLSVVASSPESPVVAISSKLASSAGTISTDSPSAEASAGASPSTISSAEPSDASAATSPSATSAGTSPPSRLEK